jgi:Tn3 transposase DDE domain
MLRLVASLKMGYVTASLIIQKLQAYPRQHPLLRALQEYGRLPKTIHILCWYSDALKRRSLNRQINKGDALHQLRGISIMAIMAKLKKKMMCNSTIKWVASTCLPTPLFYGTPCTLRKSSSNSKTKVTKSMMRT